MSFNMISIGLSDLLPPNNVTEVVKILAGSSNRTALRRDLVDYLASCLVGRSVTPEAVAQALIDSRAKILEEHKELIPPQKPPMAPTVVHTLTSVTTSEV